MPVLVVNWLSWLLASVSVSGWVELKPEAARLPILLGPVRIIVKMLPRRSRQMSAARVFLMRSARCGAASLVMATTSLNGLIVDL